MARLTWEWLHAISVPLHSDSSPTYAKIYLTTPIKHRFTNIWILCKLAGIFDRFVVFRSDYLTSWLWWVSMHGFHKSKRSVSRYLNGFYINDIKSLVYAWSNMQKSPHFLVFDSTNVSNILSNLFYDWFTI